VNSLNLNYLTKKLKLLKPDLKERFKVKTIGLFGSYVRGEQKKTSDLDILVDFYEPISLFRYIELEDFLSQQLGVKVDLVMRDVLKPRIKDSILNEAIYV
jgi:predicted nucleotidyltransferase